MSHKQIFEYAEGKLSEQIIPSMLIAQRILAVTSYYFGITVNRTNPSHQSLTRPASRVHMHTLFNIASFVCTDCYNTLISVTHCALRVINEMKLINIRLL